jgi:hypothetical protein
MTMDEEHQRKYLQIGEICTGELINKEEGGKVCMQVP